MRITEALVFCPVVTPVVIRKKGEIIRGRASTVGGQWLVKIASAWVTKGFQAGEREGALVQFLHRVNAVAHPLYLQLFQQFVVVSNRRLQRLQELLLRLQLLCHRTRPPGQDSARGERIFKMLRPCSCL